MTSVADASALAFEPPVIAASDAEDDHEANDDDRLPLTATSSDGDGDTLRNNAKIDPDVSPKDVSPIAEEKAEEEKEKEAPPPIDELPTERTPTAVEPLDLSPWLLRRTITFNKR